jgi:4-amino-4-deoxy-L-arabinose transferase-like glycosyltransferase
MEYWVARSPLSDILSTVKAALQDPPLYSILLHFWMKMGQTEFSIRFLSLIFSVAGMLGVIVLSRLAFGKKASLVAGVLMAVAVPDIRFAQEAGQYALMSCVLSWNLVFLLLLMREGTWQWSILWGISAAIAIYSYYGAALIIGATTLACLVCTISKRQWSRFFKLVIVGSVCGASVIPLAVAWLPDQFLRGPTATAFQFSIGTYQEELHRFLIQTRDFLTYQFLGYQPGGWPWPQIREWVIWLPSVWLILVSAIRYKLRLPVVWFAIGLLAYYFVGRLGAYPFGSRYSLILSFLFWSCLAAGIAALLSLSRPLSLRNALAFSFLGLFVTVSLLSPVEPQEDLRSVTRFWLSERQVGEPTYVYYGAVPGFRYQMELAGVTETVPSLWYRHCLLGTPVSYCSSNGVFYGRGIRDLLPEQKKQAVLEAIGDSKDRFWIIFSHIYPREEDGTDYAYFWAPLDKGRLLRYSGSAEGSV